MIGTTLRHYQIVRALGSGGMGEVYAADDTKLHRTVALKILPPATADDPERLARFQREAQAIAALNHPGVVTIYSVEEADGTHFLTMELVEGKTLADLVPPRGFPVTELVKLSVPLTDAVSAAHAHGVVHRDLKPSNVMVTPDGRVKVLDFGLAKLRDDTFSSVQASSRITERLTAANQIWGTPAYMSPEQTEAGQGDHRSDIFSLGVMLYEMASGTRPFKGDTTLAVISSILKDTPVDLAELRPDLPSDFDRIVRRCLAKDPTRRYQTALDLRNELEDLQLQLSRSQPLPVVAPPRSRPATRWLAGAAVLMLLGAAAFIALQWRDGRSAADSDRLQATFTQLTSQPAAELFPSLSPDGKWVIYTGEGAGNRDVYLQSTSGQTPINLTADSAADDEQPAFSPDGELIAFRSARDGGGIFVMGRTGEAVRRVTRSGFNPAWSPDGSLIVFTTGRMELRPQNGDIRSELWVVGVAGGEPRLVYRGDATLPSWAPGGKRIAFSQRGAAAGRTERHITIATVALAGGDAVLVGGSKDIDWNPVWSPDGHYLFFSSNRGGTMNLWRVAIDETSGVPRGDPQPLTTPAPFAAHPSLSADGRRLAYTSVQETQNIQTLPFDPVRGEPTGDPKSLTTGSRRWSSPDPSPDGEWVAFYSQLQPEGDLYVVRSDGTGLRQLTSDAFLDRVPRWSHDGKWIAFFSNRTGKLQLWKIRPDGGDLQQLTNLETAAYGVWAPDDGRMAASGNARNSEIEASLVLFDPTRPWSGQQPMMVKAPPPINRFAPNAWSPDGRVIAGQFGIANLGVVLFSIETERFERVSDVGEWPVWLPDGRRVLVVSRGREFHVIDTQMHTSRLVFSVDRDSIGPPRLTRDGRMAYFSRRVTEADIWLVNLQ